MRQETPLIDCIFCGCEVGRFDAECGGCGRRDFVDTPWVRMRCACPDRTLSVWVSLDAEPIQCPKCKARFRESEAAELARLTN
jgi:hypothetical protein